MSKNRSQINNYNISGQTMSDGMVGHSIGAENLSYGDCEGIASAPQMETYTGYESVSFIPTIANPPLTYAETIRDNILPIDRQIPISAVICEEEIRNALNTFVSQNCCFGSKPAKEIIILDIIMNNVFHYKLETFTEKREPQWVFKPFKGELISCPTFGRPPTPWEVFVVPEITFKTSQKIVEIPQTACVRDCHTCTGNTRIRCTQCLGFPISNCQFCDGSGRTDNHHYNNSCVECNGTGRIRCGHCEGHGMVKCQTCEGFGKLKFYLQLTVNWINHEEDYINREGNDLQEDLIKDVSGNIVLEDRCERVRPLTNFVDRSLIEASKRLIQNHCHSYPSERILEQRQTVRVIPIALVCYNYRQNIGNFHVYGLEHKVHFPHYPSKCCCGCTLL